MALPTTSNCFCKHLINGQRVESTTKPYRAEFISFPSVSNLGRGFSLLGAAEREKFHTYIDAHRRHSTWFITLCQRFGMGHTFILWLSIYIPFVYECSEHELSVAYSLAAFRYR